MTKNTSTPTNPPPTPGHVGVEQHNGQHRDSAQALDVRAEFLLRGNPALLPLSRADAVGLVHGHLPSRRTGSSSRGIITHAFNKPLVREPVGREDRRVNFNDGLVMLADAMPGVNRIRAVQRALDGRVNPVYLEIGVSRGQAFQRISADVKIAVDPAFRLSERTRELADAKATRHPLLRDDQRRLLRRARRPSSSSTRSTSR